MILITGAAGLIGRTLQRTLTAAGIAYFPVDVVYPEDSINYMDITETKLPEELLTKCQGVIHLAAVSRVLWGEQDPVKCRRVNVDGTEKILQLANNLSNKPWFIYASSREVYGQQATLPVKEDAKQEALNHYAASKIAAERLVKNYAKLGLKTVILRFSNVYGDIQDHRTRVIPAFCRAAALRQPMHVQGPDNLFDFTHVEDVVRGIMAVIARITDHDIPDIHFTTGEPSSLGQLASLTNQLAGNGSEIIIEAPRNYDVATFYGDPARARKYLNWRHTTPLALGLNRMILAYRKNHIVKQEDAVI